MQQAGMGDMGGGMNGSAGMGGHMGGGFGGHGHGGAGEYIYTENLKKNCKIFSKNIKK